MINVRYVDDNNTAVEWETLNGDYASSLATSREVLNYIDAGGKIEPYSPPIVDPKEQARADLAASDKEMARIAEDLINIMVNNGLIKKEDLPKPVIAKLESRANLRKVLQADGD